MPKIAQHPALPRIEQGSGSHVSIETLSWRSSHQRGRSCTAISPKGAAMNHGFIETLAATGPHPSLGANADTYARVIGSWHGELSRFQDGKSVASASVE